MRQITREKSSTSPGGMNTISFQQVRLAPKTFPIVYKFYIILRTPLRQPTVKWGQSTDYLMTPANSHTY